MIVNVSVAWLPKMPPRQDYTTTVERVQIPDKALLQMMWNMLAHLKGQDPVRSGQLQHGVSQVRPLYETPSDLFHIASAVISSILMSWFHGQ